MTARKMFAPGEMKLDEAGHIVAAFAQLNVVDSDNDVTLPGAFPSKDVPMSAYGHTSWEGALPVGMGTISEKGDWAVFEGDFFMATTHGHDAYATVKGLGPLAEYSYGYDVLDSTSGTHDGQPVRELRSLDVFEVSPVLKGAGVGTHTLAIKSDAPGTDASYAEHLSWYVDGLTALIERTKDRAEFRASEGRKLSAADLARLADLESRLTEHLEAVKAAQVVPEDPEVIRQRQQAIAVATATARRLGVDVPDKE